MTGRRDLCIMACIFCREPEFLKWLTERAGAPIDEAGAKAFILKACDVKSRNDLDGCWPAAELFHAMVRKPYLAWKEQRDSLAAFTNPALGEPWTDGGAP